MVNEIKKQRKKVYECEECKLIYKAKSWAEKCEEWCKKNNSCNIEITKHALKNRKKITSNL